MTGDLYRTNSGALDCRPNPNSFCWSSVNPGDSYPPKEGDAVVLHFKSGDVYGEVVKSSEDGIQKILQKVKSLYNQMKINFSMRWIN